MAIPNLSGLSYNGPTLTPKAAELISKSGSDTSNVFNLFGKIFIKQSNLSLLNFSIELIIEGSSFIHVVDIFILSFLNI